VQAESLDKALAEGTGRSVDVAVYIGVGRDELVKRLSNRWLCRQCQTPYNRAQQSDFVTVCSKCGGELYQRSDDVLETVQKRLEVYFRDTVPLIEYYRQRGILAEIDGCGNVDDILVRIVNAIGDGK
jgi:adenylate kinase